MDEILYEDLLEEFSEDLRDLFESGASEDELNEEVLAIILLLFALGAGYDGVDDVTGDDREWLDEMFRMTVASAPGIIARAESGADMEPTVVKVTNHAAGAYNYALMMHGMEESETWEWVMGPTEHCGDCVSYAAMGPLPSGRWAAIADQRGHYPQSPQLECKGLHCQCRLKKSNG